MAGPIASVSLRREKAHLHEEKVVHRESAWGNWSETIIPLDAVTGVEVGKTHSLAMAILAGYIWLSGFGVALFALFSPEAIKSPEALWWMLGSMLLFALAYLLTRRSVLKVESASTEIKLSGYFVDEEAMRAFADEVARTRGWLVGPSTHQAPRAPAR